MTTNLSQQQVEQLAPYTFDCRGLARPRYGAPLEEAISGVGWSWLEAVVMSGRLPHFEGISLAARASVLYWRAEMSRAERCGVDGDAIGWTQGSGALWDPVKFLEPATADLASGRASLLARVGTGTPADGSRTTSRTTTNAAGTQLSRTKRTP